MTQCCFRPPMMPTGATATASSAFDTEIEAIRGRAHRGSIIVETLIADQPGWRIDHAPPAPPIAPRRRKAPNAPPARARRSARRRCWRTRSRTRCRGFAARRNCSRSERRGGRTHPADHHRGRPDRRVDRPDAGFHRHAPAQAASRPISIRCSITPAASRRPASRATVTIEESFDPSLPPVLVDSRCACCRCCINLFKNAAEALCDAAGAADHAGTAYRHGMAVEPGPGRPRQPLPIEICVIDNGPGAPADIADHLFDPFVSGKPEGQGLGLALVDKLVRDMGGVVQYAREGDPEMTVFRILLAEGRHERRRQHPGPRRRRRDPHRGRARAAPRGAPRDDRREPRRAATAR